MQTKVWIVATAGVLVALTGVAQVPSQPPLSDAAFAVTLGSAVPGSSCALPRQQAHFAEQEKLHREERDRHAAELEAAFRHLEELREMAARLGQVVQHARVLPPEAEEEAVGRRSTLSQTMDRVLEHWPPDLPFTATSLADEVQRRYGAVLRRDADPRVIASALRRRHKEGLVQKIREGRPHLEAQYRKGK